MDRIGGNDLGKERSVDECDDESCEWRVGKVVPGPRPDGAVVVLRFAAHTESEWDAYTLRHLRRRVPTVLHPNKSPLCERRYENIGTDGLVVEVQQSNSQPRVGAEGGGMKL